MTEQEELRAFCKDVLTLIAGIGWFNVDKEKKRVYTYIAKHCPELLKIEGEE